jgi:hypothetical protein
MTTMRDILAMVPQVNQPRSQPIDLFKGYNRRKMLQEQIRHAKALEQQARTNQQELQRSSMASEGHERQKLKFDQQKEFSKRTKEVADFVAGLDPTDPRQMKMAEEAMEYYKQSISGSSPALAAPTTPTPGIPTPVTPPPSQVNMGAMVAPGEEAMGGITPEGKGLIKQMQAPMGHDQFHKAPPESEVGRDLSMAAPGLGLAPLMMGAAEQQPMVDEEPSLEKLMQQATGFDEEGNTFGPIPSKQESTPQPDMMVGGGVAPGMVGPTTMQPTGTFGQLIQSMAGPEPTTDDVKAVRDIVDTSFGLKPKLEASERAIGDSQVTTFYDDGVPLGSMNTTWMTPKDKQLLGIAAKAAAEDDPAAGAWAVGELTGDKKEALKFIKDVARNINRRRNVRGGMSRKTKDKGNKEAATWMEKGRQEVQRRYDKPKKGAGAFFELRADIASARKGLKMASDPKSDLTNLLHKAQYAIARAREPGGRLSDMDIKATGGLKSYIQQAREFVAGKIKMTPEALRDFIKRFDTELGLLAEEVELKLATMYETEEKGLLSAVNEAQYMGIAKTIDSRYGGRNVRGYKKLRAGRKMPVFPYSVPVPMDPEYLAQEAAVEEAAKGEKPTEAEDIMDELDSQFGYDEMSLER